MEEAICVEKNGEDMIDETKIRLMTKAAMIRKKDKKRTFTATNFYGGDFVSLQVIKTVIGVTMAFAIIFGLWVLPDAEEIMTTYHIADLLDSAKFILIIYIAVLLISILLTVLVYTSQYWKARNSMRAYNSTLKKIEKIYRAQDAPPKE